VPTQYRDATGSCYE